MPPTSERLHFSSAVSTAGRSADAAARVVRRLSQQHPTAGADLVLAFTTPEHTDAFDVLQQALHNAFRPTVLIIATGDGVLGTGESVERGPGVSVMAANLPGVTLEPFAWESQDWPSVLAGKGPRTGRLAEPGDGTPPPANGMLILADRDTAPWVDLLPKLEAAYPGAAVAGGLLTSHDQTDGTRMLINGRLQDAGAIGVIFRGEIEIACRVGHGTRPIGRPHVITEAAQQKIHSLGGRPALGMARAEINALPEAQQQLAAEHGWFLGQVINEYQPRFGRGDFQVREVLSVDESTGSLVIGDAAMTVGHTVQVHVPDPGCVAADLGLLLEAQKLHHEPAGMLLFSSSRRGEPCDPPGNRDPAMIERALGPAPLVGLCPDGEIGPGRAGPFVHMQAASMMLFRQAQHAPVAGSRGASRPRHNSETI
jgi:small ligand-binding sensory domain FIST